MSPDSPAQAGALTRDTSREAEHVQTSHWRTRSPLEIAQLVTGASRAALTMALAGLRERHPDASDDELQQRLACLTMGPALARQVYPGTDGPYPDDAAEQVNLPDLLERALCEARSGKSS